MSIYTDILKQYWGYENFRSPQDLIIESIAEGKDTLGLMPTGGGKSITFQVYSMSVEGTCLVVTPLIALMKDQVENLKKKKISAAAIYSGMTQKEIEVTLKNVIYGGYKFLYLSPERLKTYYFREMLKQMKINLITVDEAHCISQWGYDFRPPYLEIAEIRDFFPDIPILALTATATPEVVVDIQDKLKFSEYNVIQKSFERKNLIYSVIHSEDKINSLFKLLNKHQGSCVIYVRNRKKTKEYAQILQHFGVSADFYHAGLDAKEREEKQLAWQNDIIKIIVCTNAFGMGIDKPDVRLVVHLDIPDSLEAYFQEAGRAGRDGKKANAYILYNVSDISLLKRNFTNSFPPIDKIVEIYNAIADYFEISIDEGSQQTYSFNIFDFAKLYEFNIEIISNALKILEICDVLTFSPNINHSARLNIICNRDELYNFQLYSGLSDFIKLILRSYTGVFTDFVNINEDFLGNKMNTDVKTIYGLLNELQTNNIIDYIPKSKNPEIQFILNRKENIKAYIDNGIVNEQKERYRKRLDAMLNYVESNNKCRSKLLLEYFGENNSKSCSYCDVCSRKNNLGITKYEFETIGIEIKRLLQNNPMLINDIVDSFNDFENEKIIKVIQWCLDNNRIKYNDERQLIWLKK